MTPRYKAQCDPISTPAASSPMGDKADGGDAAAARPPDVFRAAAAMGVEGSATGSAAPFSLPGALSNGSTIKYSPSAIFSGACGGLMDGFHRKTSHASNFKQRVDLHVYRWMVVYIEKDIVQCNQQQNFLLNISSQKCSIHDVTTVIGYGCVVRGFLRRTSR